MINTNAYSPNMISRRMHVSLKKYLIILFYLFSIFQGISCFAQEEPEYDEISVFLDIPRLGEAEIDAVIKGETVYLPVTDLFDFFFQLRQSV